MLYSTLYVYFNSDKIVHKNIKIHTNTEYKLHRLHRAGVEVTPLVASTPAYHVQGCHHGLQMFKRPCSSVPVQRPIQYAG